MQLTPFEKIIKLAEERKGGKHALEKLLATHKPLSTKQLAKVPDLRRGTGASRLACHPTPSNRAQRVSLPHWSFAANPTLS